MLTLAVLNYNGKGYLEDCLKSVGNIPDEKLLIDNNSDDESWKIAEDYGFKVIHADNLCQFITGINCALKSASSEYILFTQGDVRFEPGSIQELYNNAIVHQNSIIQPVFIRPGYGIDNAGMNLIWPAYGIGIRKIKSASVYKTDVATSITFITTLEVIQKVGLYDEKFAPAYLEDVDWALRSRPFGVRHLVCPKAFVTHRHNESFSKKYSKLDISRICRKNRKYLVRKHYRGFWGIVASAVTAMLDVTKETIDVITQWWRSSYKWHKFMI